MTLFSLLLVVVVTRHTKVGLDLDCTKAGLDSDYTRKSDGNLCHFFLGTTSVWPTDPLPKLTPLFLTQFGLNLIDLTYSNPTFEHDILVFLAPCQQRGID